MLLHLARGVMERQLEPGRAWERRPLLFLVDPHQDLAAAVLSSAPGRLADQIQYLNFADLQHLPALNLLDPQLFPLRDRQVDNVVTALRAIWPDSWGPRMEFALRVSLTTLYAANRSLSTDDLHTLCDVPRLLTDHRWRKAMVEQVGDERISAAWEAAYVELGVSLQRLTASPIMNKVGPFLLSESANQIFGRSRSNLDLRGAVRAGGVLIVNTASSTIGRDSALLTGATLINMLALAIEQQGRPRRRVIGIIDEASTLGAVDYRFMLSELAKFGGSFILATQSLTQLDKIDGMLVQTMLANIDGLTAFRCSAEDARRLAPELGSPITVEDIVSLDDYVAYARWWQDHQKPPAFGFQVAPPPNETAGADLRARNGGRPSPAG